jgi:hypothetical protein
VGLTKRESIQEIQLWEGGVMCNSSTCPNNPTGIGADFLCDCVAQHDIQTCKNKHRYIAKSHEYPCPFCEKAKFEDRLAEVERERDDLRKKVKDYFFWYDKFYYNRSPTTKESFQVRHNQIRTEAALREAVKGE